MCDQPNEDGPWSEDERLTETVNVLKSIVGGAELLNWFGGVPEFGDSELMRLDLDRRGATMTIATMVSEKGHYGGPPYKHAEITFFFKRLDIIDLSLEGFAHQNVMGGLWMRFAEETSVHTSLQGIGLGQGDIEIEIEPCAGAFGTLRATIEKITITPVDDDQKADELSSMTE